MRRLLRIYFFNRIRPGALALVRPGSFTETKRFVPVVGGFQLFGGRNWTVSLIRLGDVEVAE